MPAPMFDDDDDDDDDEDRLRQGERGFAMLLREVTACEREVARILRRQAMRKARGQDASSHRTIEMELRHLANLRQLAEMGRSLVGSMYRPAIVPDDRPEPQSRDLTELRARLAAMRPASPSRR